jgi:hypothetical protein
MIELFLRDSWDEVVSLYMKGKINSERTLQAAYYSKLVDRLPEDYFLLCEPSIRLESIGLVIPDLVIVSGNEVKSAIELKFVPHDYPHVTDIQKLAAYTAARDRFPMLLNPATGKFSEQRFAFSPDCALVFGVIGQHDSLAVDKVVLEEKMTVLKRQLIHLCHAVGKTNGTVQ